MTKEEVIRNYPMLKHRLFQRCLNSILALDADGLTDDRASLMDFFDTWADSDDDMFFYDMLIHVIFIDENVTAYTTPDKKICLNYPCEDIIPQDSDRWRRWYFIYCHECMHKLWDTFDVGNEIMRKVGTCDGEILNIASDIVINDFLENINNSNKLIALNIWTPAELEKDYGIKYDRRIDTQFTLYCKMMELDAEKRKKMKNQKETSNQDIVGGQQSQSGGQSGGQSGQGGSGQQQHSDAWIEGWNKALEDYKNGKIKL